MIWKNNNFLARIEASKLVQCTITEEQSIKINTLWWNQENGSLLTDSQS